MIHRHLLALALSLAGMPLAYGSCGQAAAIVHSAYPAATRTAAGGYLDQGARIDPEPGDFESAHAVTCKRWAAHPDRVLALVPRILSETDDETHGDLDVLVLDRSSLRVEQRLRLPGYLDDDALRIERLDLDTAYYRLAPDVIAFGVRKTLEGSSRPNPFEEVDLSLFAPDGRRLRRVLDGLVVARSNGEWDTQCAGHFSELHRTLAMSDTSSHGRTDIVVATRGEERENRPDANGTCSENTRPKAYPPVSLHFDGTRFVVPKELAPLP